MSLADVRQQISEDWEALTPPDHTTVRFHEATGELSLEGAAAHRCFVHSPPADGQLLEAPPNLGRWLYTWIASVLISGVGYSIPDLFDTSYRTAHLFASAVNTRSVWPDGTVLQARPYVTGFRVVELGEELLEIQIELTAVIDEPYPEV